MTPNNRKVVGAVVDTQHLILHHPDGTETKIRQGDPRLAPIVDFITPICATGGIAELPPEMLTLDGWQLQVRNAETYKEYEKNSNGLTRFFRMSMTALKNLFTTRDADQGPPVPSATEHVIPQTIGPGKPDEKAMKLLAACEQIQAHAAVPVDEPSFNDVVSADEETIVAVTGDGAIIPDAHKLHGYLEDANKRGSIIGMQRFLERAGNVSKTRRHTVEELLRFMERGDLPVDNNGDLVAYKILRRKDDKFVDCHSGNVPQQLSSYVFMNESLVDPNRNNECSNGLHIARRGYLGGFSGDVCVIAKIRPEDVVAVPTYDSNKVRVKGYTIVHVLSAEQFKKVKADKPMTDDEEGRKLLADMLNCVHAEVIETVEITQAYGGGVIITPIQKEVEAVVEDQATTVAVEIETEVEPVSVGVEAINVSDEEPKKPETIPAPVLDPRQVAKAALETKTASEPAATVPEPAPQGVVVKMASEARQREAKKLYDAWRDATSEKGRKNALQKLKEFKNKARVSWESLGIPNPATVELMPIVTKADMVATAMPGKTSAPDVMGPKHHAPRVIQEKKPGQTKLTSKEQATQFVAKNDAAGLLKFKKEKGKGWGVLGVTEEQLKKLGIK